MHFRGPCAAMMFVAVACERTAEQRRDTPAVASLPIVIDTAFPTVMGYAVHRHPGGWCLVTSRNGMWNGKPVRLALLKEVQYYDGHVRERVASCAPADSTRGVNAFALEIPRAPAEAGTIGIVMRDDVFGNIDGRTKILAGNFDGIEGLEFAQECIGERELHLFITSDSANGRLRWHHRVPLRDLYRAGRPHCNRRLGEAAAPIEPAVPPGLDETRPSGRIVLPGTPTLDTALIGEVWTAVRKRENQIEVLDALPSVVSAARTCSDSSTSRHSLRPDFEGAWLALLSDVQPVRKGLSVAPQIADTGAHRTLQDSVIVIHEGRSLIVRAERLGQEGMHIYIDVAGARSTLFARDYYNYRDTWRIPLALDYDGDGGLDIMLSITSGDSTETRFHLSSRRPAFGGRWPVAAMQTVPEC